MAKKISLEDKETIKVLKGWYCEDCETLCFFYEQGLACDCGQPWETQVVEESEYPSNWIKVNIVVKEL